MIGVSKVGTWKGVRFHLLGNFNPMIMKNNNNQVNHLCLKHVNMFKIVYNTTVLFELMIDKDFYSL